jgi:hypothetical protein
MPKRVPDCSQTPEDPIFYRNAGVMVSDSLPLFRPFAGVGGESEIPFATRNASPAYGAAHPDGCAHRTLWGSGSQSVFTRNSHVTFPSSRGWLKLFFSLKTLT